MGTWGYGAPISGVITLYLGAAHLAGCVLFFCGNIYGASFLVRYPKVTVELHEKEATTNMDENPTNISLKWPCGV